MYWPIWSAHWSRKIGNILQLELQQIKNGLKISLMLKNHQVYFEQCLKMVWKKKFSKEEYFEKHKAVQS